MNRREAIATAVAGLLGALLPKRVLNKDGRAVWCDYKPLVPTKPFVVKLTRNNTGITYCSGGKQVRWKVTYREK